MWAGRGWWSISDVLLILLPALTLMACEGWPADRSPLAPIYGTCHRAFLSGTICHDNRFGSATSCHHECSKRTNRSSRFVLDGATDSAEPKADTPTTSHTRHERRDRVKC